MDGDGYSDLPSLRGTSWKGKDCNDLDKNIYPGRVVVNGDVVIDTNCNGIYGIDNSTKTSYEEQWCNNTGRFSICTTI